MKIWRTHIEMLVDGVGDPESAMHVSGLPQLGESFLGMKVSSRSATPFIGGTEGAYTVIANLDSMTRTGVPTKETHLSLKSPGKFYYLEHLPVA